MTETTSESATGPKSPWRRAARFVGLVVLALLVVWLPLFAFAALDAAGLMLTWVILALSGWVFFLLRSPAFAVAMLISALTPVAFVALFVGDLGG